MKEALHRTGSTGIEIRATASNYKLDKSDLFNRLLHHYVGSLGSTDRLTILQPMSQIYSDEIPDSRGLEISKLSTP
jgi:hypothetical protein